MAVSFVLGSQEILTVPRRVRLRFLLACGLVHGHFELPHAPRRSLALPTRSVSATNSPPAARHAWSMSKRMGSRLPFPLRRLSVHLNRYLFQTWRSQQEGWIMISLS